jgi:hypothetical protein
VVNLVSAALHANTVESPKDAKKTGKSKNRRMQTVRDRVKTLLLSRRKQKKAKQAASASV